MKHNLAILKAARALELTVAAIILAVIVCGGALLLWNTGKALLQTPETFSVGNFLSSALLLVMGLEFVKMLGVAAVAAIFAVKKFLQVPETEEH